MEDQREFELEALQSIFMEDLTVMDHPGHFEIKILPIPDAEDQLDNKVAIKMEVKLPLNYPSVLPEIHLRVDRGVSSKNCTILENRVREESEKLVGEQMIFMLTSIVKEWLDEHNDESDTKDQQNSKLNQFVESSFDKEGTPVTVETFNLWWKEFRTELEKKKYQNGYRKIDHFRKRIFCSERKYCFSRYLRTLLGFTGH